MQLLPCPFCGEDAGADAPRVVDEPTKLRTWYRAECFRCRIRAGSYAAEDGAIKHWNMRSRPKTETFGPDWWKGNSDKLVSEPEN